MVLIAGVAAVSAIMYGCRKAYNPRAIKQAPRVLVVEGAINSTSDLTIFRLTRTIPADSSGESPVVGATLTVEGDNNTSYVLTEGNIGYYYYTGLNLDTTRKYRLHIKTADAPDEYVSDYVPVKTTPPIDSIGFTVKNNGIQVYVNTHDSNNKTRYYRWDYEETWQFHSEFTSGYYSDGYTLQPRTIDQQIYSCFADSLSSNIVLSSSAKLSSDVIFQAPVVFISSTSEKIETKYSILLHQYALTPDAYNFWANLRKNTEELGTIFDAQPSNINGNIYSISKNSEPVVGFVTACAVQSKRIFISKDQLPQSWRPVTPYQCSEDTFLYHNKSGQDQTRALIALPPLDYATSAVAKDGLIVGFLGADRSCVDCTLRGFTQRPTFWK
ncbi:MAG: DUF4249 domain-containing protein [Mucilaginibacter sp.]